MTPITLDEWHARTEAAATEARKRWPGLRVDVRVHARYVRVSAVANGIAVDASVSAGKAVPEVHVARWGVGASASAEAAVEACAALFRLRLLGVRVAL